MKVSLCMTVYDRADLLEQVFNALEEYPPGVDEIVIVADGPKDLSILPLGNRWKDRMKLVVGFQGDIRLIEQDNQGIAKATNRSLAEATGDVLIHCDSDVFIKKAGWAKELADFLVKHQEVGIAAPDLPSRYMRISRPDYDEIEYALGAVMAVRRDVYDTVHGSHGNGFFDENIHHQWDPDVCYRARMLGYRVGIVDVGEFVDLGAGTGDSSRPSSFLGGYEFQKKWNVYHLGFFRYKSPVMLRWDEFPLNYVWRKLWLAQNEKGADIVRKTIQWHEFDMVRFPISVGKWQMGNSIQFVAKNLVAQGVDAYEKIDPELLAGKRNWKPEDWQ